MSEIMQTRRTGIRKRLLATASALALSAVCGAQTARADDDGKPLFWIELGGQYVQLEDGQQRYAPPFLSPVAAIPLPTTLPSPLPAQKLPASGYDWNGKLSLEPDGWDWVFSAAIRYGRSSGSGHVQKTLTPHISHTSYGGSVEIGNADYINAKSYEQQTHAIFDFMAGKDVGLGMFGGTSVLSGGIRIAQFASRQMASVNADPDYQFSGPHDIFKNAVQAKRGFNGIGPALSWDASAPVWGNMQNGALTVDWGGNAAVLFGRRKVDIHHQTSQCHKSYPIFPCLVVYSSPGDIKRSRQATVPNLGGFAGLSWRYTNAKISLGYRADFFFHAMDVGIDADKSQTLGFYGPFASVSVGIGG